MAPGLPPSRRLAPAERYHQPVLLRVPRRVHVELAHERVDRGFRQLAAVSERFKVRKCDGQIGRRAGQMARLSLDFTLARSASVPVISGSVTGGSFFRIAPSLCLHLGKRVGKPADSVRVRDGRDG